MNEPLLAAAVRSPCGQICVAFEQNGVPIVGRWRDLESRMRACPECGHLAFAPLPSATVLSEYYRSQYWNPASSAQEARLLYDDSPAIAEIADTIRRTWTENGRLEGDLRLHDVGCGYGAVVNALARVGVRASGSDLSDTSVALAHELGNPLVETASLDDYCAARPGHGINFFFMSHSLEHMPDPEAAVRRIHTELPAGGLVMIRVPNAMHALARLQSLYEYTWLQYPDHLILFSPHSLSCLLMGCGFDVVSISTLVREDHMDRALSAIFGRAAAALPNAGSLIAAMAENLLGQELQIVARKAEFGEALIDPALRERTRALEADCANFRRMPAAGSLNGAEFDPLAGGAWSYSCLRKSDFTYLAMVPGPDGKSLVGLDGTNVLRSVQMIAPTCEVSMKRRSDTEDGSEGLFRVSYDGIVPFGEDATWSIEVRVNGRQLIQKTWPARVRGGGECFVAARGSDAVEILTSVANSFWPALFVNVNVERLDFEKA